MVGRRRTRSGMSVGGRYQSQELYLQQADVSCYRGVDPLTGLAVLIYTFPEPPTVAAGALESENIPGILVSSFDDAMGQVVVAYSPHYRPVSAGTPVDDRLVLSVLRGIRDAAGAGVVHGDLRAGRLLHSQGHVLLEGYGVPWRPAEPAVTAPEVAAGGPPSLASDIYAAAATLLALGGDRLSAAVQRALSTALAEDPADRPSAGALFTLVRRSGGGAVTSPSRSFDELTLPTAGQPSAPADANPATSPDSGARSLSATRSDFQLDLDFELNVDAPAYDHRGEDGGSDGGRQAPSARRVTTAASDDGYDDPDPITVHSDPGLTPPGERPAGTKQPTFVKAPPPGATYRAGTVDERAPAPIPFDMPPPKRAARRSWRGPLVLLLVLVVGGGLAALAFLRQGGVAPAPSGAGGVNYIVSVQVQPGNLPPVDLYVAKSPSGSATPAGTIICRAPCKVVLDRPGQWQFIGQFQGRRSRPASVTLPGQRYVVVTFPPNAPGSAGTGR